MNVFYIIYIHNFALMMPKFNKYIFLTLEVIVIKFFYTTFSKYILGRILVLKRDAWQAVWRVFYLAPNLETDAFCSCQSQADASQLFVRRRYFISPLPSISVWHTHMRHLGTRSLGVTGYHEGQIPQGKTIPKQRSMGRTIQFGRLYTQTFEDVFKKLAWSQKGVIIDGGFMKHINLQTISYC